MSHGENKAQSSMQIASINGTILHDVNCSVDLRSTTAVGDRRYSPFRNDLCCLA
jgi:hypothetical protein